MSTIKDTEVSTTFTDFLNEGKIGNFLKRTKTNISSFVKKIISSIGFGQTKKIQLSSINERISQGMQSQLGYYSEYVTAQRIIDLMESQNLSVSLNGNSSNPSSAINKKVSDYRNHILSIDSSLESDVMSQEQQGARMGDSIYDDAIMVSDDLILLHFNVILTGDSLKGQNKADVVVEIKKQDTNEVIDNIMASLKSYKKWSINLANNTLTSFFDNIGVTLNKSDLNKLKQLQDVRRSVWRHYVNDDYNGLRKLYGNKVASKAKPLFKDKYVKKSKPTDQQKKYVKEAHDAIQRDISDYFVSLLTKEYNKNKKSINKKILALLGFDGTDDFYLAVKQKEKISVLSNRTSKKYKELIDRIQEHFELKIMYKSSAPTTINIEFYDVKGSKLLSSKISIGQTASVGQSRTNWWVDFKPFKSDAR